MKLQPKYRKTLSWVIPITQKDLTREGDGGRLARKRGWGRGFVEEAILEVALGG